MSIFLESEVSIFLVCIYCILKSRSIRYFKNKVFVTCLFLVYSLYKVFSKNQKSSETIPTALFWHDFWRKIFLTLYSINWRNSLAWLPLVFEIFDNIRIAIICFLVCDTINFEINLGFPITLFSYITKSSKKYLYILRTKKALNIEWKTFFIISKDL